MYNHSVISLHWTNCPRVLHWHAVGLDIFYGARVCDLNAPSGFLWLPYTHVVPGCLDMSFIERYGELIHNMILCPFKVDIGHG